MTGINGKITSEKDTISNGFNKFFIEIGPNLARKCPRSDKSPMHWMNPENVHSIFLEPVTEDEIIKLVIPLKEG